MDHRTTRRAALRSMAAGVAFGAMWDQTTSAAALAEPNPDGGIVNVRTFGAVGDGIADDTGAILAAVEAAFDPMSKARNHVYFPAGTYLVSQSITLDYGIVIEGAGPAASVIKMSSSVLSQMFVGSGGFPVYIEFRNIQLDGGYGWVNSKLDVPRGAGSVGVSGPHTVGMFSSELQISTPSVSIELGDVLRTPGQPATFSADNSPRKIGYSGGLYTPLWAPAVPLATTTKWSIFKSGDLISNIGRLIVDNCALVGAKRHCISLPASGEIRITRSKIGVSQGCGVFSNGAGDGAIANCWFIETGGANIYTYGAFDFRFAHCLIEGGAVANVYSDWGQVKIASSDLWGGRAGNIVARQSGWIRGVDLQLRDPATGGVAGAIGSSSWARPAPRPAIECHFADGNVGAVLTGVALVSAADNLGSFSPQSVVRIANGSRSSLSQIEFDDRITFAAAPIQDEGVATATRGCRGHVVAPRAVHTAPGGDAVVVNHLGVPAALTIATTAHRIISVKMGTGSDAIEVFNSGSSGAEPWQRRFTTPLVSPGAAVTISTEPSETAVSTIWFGV